MEVLDDNQCLGDLSLVKVNFFYCNQLDFEWN